MRILCLAVLLALVPACGDDDDPAVDGGAPDATVDARTGGADATTAAIAGGWSGGGLYACFAADGRADFGDNASEVAANPCCTWNADGTIAFGGGGTATWMIVATSLVVAVDPPCGTECGPVTYTRDPNLVCFP